MAVKFLYPFWGSETLDPSEFFQTAVFNKFDGVEINLPEDSVFEEFFLPGLNVVRLKNPDFLCSLQQAQGVKGETPDEYLLKVINKLENLRQYQPDFINSHTGKDHFSFSDNCKIIEAIEEFSIKHNVPVYHEIHRGRFTFHLSSTLKYLELFPHLRFVGDLSHWCVVSESLLQDQEEMLGKIIPRIFHIHARIGHEQAPQVNNPFAPEWGDHLNRFIEWWQEIIDYHRDTREITITPEFGPVPYMPTKPFSKEPLANQNRLNLEMKDYLKSNLV